MRCELKRIFISDLPNNVEQTDIENKFNKYGSVSSVEIKKRKEVGPKNQTDQFAFINIQIDDQSLQQCFHEFSSQKWKGHYVEIQLAKESFLDRLKRERAEQSSQQNGEEKPPAPVSTPTKPEVPPKLNGTIKSAAKIKKYASSTEDESSSESEMEELKKPNGTRVVEPVLNLKEVYSDIVVKDNRSKKASTKIESVGFEPIIRMEIGKKAKSKDPKRTEADQKRINSMMVMKRGYMQQKSMIQAALSKIDLQPRSNTNFEEPSKKPYKKSEQTSKTTAKQALFNDDEDEVAEGDFNFDVKKQFEGAKGQKLFELQSRYKNDDRFQMDSRFAENEEEEEGMEGVVEEEVGGAADEISEEEKQKQLEILGQVLGRKMTSKNANAESQKRKVMLRFDPSQPEHSKYEVKEAPPEKKKRKSAVEKDEEAEVVPEVSKETFYQVTDTLKESLQEKESFSLLTMFGRSNEDKETSEELQDGIMTDISKSKNKVGSERNPFRYDSTDDEDEPEAKNKVTETEGQKQQTVKLGTSRLWTEPFFFQADDYRFQEGLDFIKRLEVDEKEEFTKMRRDLKGIVRAKVRNNQRNNKPFKKKLGGSSRKKMIRVKKTLKR